MIYRDGLRTHPFDLKNTVGYNGIMDFYVEKKQAIIIGLLVFGLLAGGAILWRQNGAGFLGANLSRALGGAGGWTEIKPRVANSTGTPAAPRRGKKQNPPKPQSRRRLSGAGLRLRRLPAKRVLFSTKLRGWELLPATATSGWN